MAMNKGGICLCILVLCMSCGVRMSHVESRSQDLASTSTTLSSIVETSGESVITTWQDEVEEAWRVPVDSLKSEELLYRRQRLSVSRHTRDASLMKLRDSASVVRQESARRLEDVERPASQRGIRGHMRWWIFGLVVGVLLGGVVVLRLMRRGI